MTTSQGYSFGNGAYVGLGLGAGFDLDGSVYIPLFMDAKYNFIDNKVSPFASVRTGIRFSPEVDSYISWGFSLGGGVDFGRFSVKLGYEYYAAKASIYSQGGYEAALRQAQPALLQLRLQLLDNSGCKTDRSAPQTCFQPFPGCKST